MNSNENSNFNDNNSSQTHEIEKLKIEKQHYDLNNKNRLESKKQVVNREIISFNNQIAKDILEDSTEEQNNDNTLVNNDNTNDFQRIIENENVNDKQGNSEGLVKQLADREIEKAKAKINASVLKFLLKNPIILGIVVFIIVFFAIIITFMVMDIDLVGTGITSYSKAEVMQVNCSSITLIKENERFTGPAVASIEYVDINETFMLPDRTTANRWETKTYQLDEYVKGVVNAEASKVNDEKTYEVAAIVARTYALSITSSKCYTFSNENTRYSNPQQFEELTSSSQYYSDISKAVSDTMGTVLTKDDNLYDHSNESYYDYFCYKERTYDGEGNYYKMLQENEEERLNIPLDWKEENVSSSLENVNCQKNGMSLFGAKYLLNNGVNAYNTLRVLKYYYGYDVVFKRVSISSSFGASCGSFSMTSTTLSRDEFVNLVNSYSSSNANFQTLKNHAGEIYDMSILNGFNPELVYARAEVEGYSPGGRTYNYYGINCSNNGGGRDCKSYSSVMDGVLNFINIMQNYSVETLFDVYNVKHYAYIGAQWYPDTGNWGKGGCIYLPSIQKYMSSDRYNVVKTSCDLKTSIPTIAEDQEAYSHFQIEAMLNARKRIFNIDEDNCDNGQTSSSILASNASYQEKIQYIYPDGIPTTQEAVNSYLVSVSVPITKKDGTKTNTTIKLHKSIANDVVQALTAAQNEGFKVYDVQSLRDWGRCTSQGAGSISSIGLTMGQHCYGLAVDINPTENGQFKNGKWTSNWLWDPDRSEYSITSGDALYKSFISNGWGWGGEWQSSKDYMHFSFFGT